MTIDQGRIIIELPRLRRYALKLTESTVDADDLVQDTVLMVLCKQRLYVEGDLRAWMFTIMHNCYVNNTRRSTRRATVLLDSDAPSYSNADASILAHEVVEEIERLPQTQRRLIELITGGASYAEAARRERIPIGTVRSRLWRARAKLHEFTT
jgi:RNA polymerase sigma-70 factor (ECF subfamily)